MRYTVFPVSAQAHLFEISLTITQPMAQGQIVRLPTWSPGSYLIREFARHIMAISAESAGVPVPLQQLDKASWQAAPVNQALTIRYRLYAFDLSVRGAYLDNERGFINGSSVFLSADQHADALCEVLIQRAAGADWQLATALDPVEVAADGFGRYQAENYQHLIDCPIEMGRFERVAFAAGQVRHQLVVSGHERCDVSRLAQDAQRICQAQIDFFGGTAPFSRYLFLLYVGDGLYGGLEHRDATALMCAPKCLPQSADEPISDDYLQLLGLISHEYFHAWNVKRIKPAAFSPYDLRVENYTRLLWAFEGITSYYDDLFLLRSQLIDRRRYLGVLAKTISAYQRNLGREQQTLAASGFCAWTQYYRPDENTPNAVVSYYIKGALVALCLDLFVRQHSNQTLDTIMQALWQKWQSDQQGLAENEWESLAETVTGLPLTVFFDTALRSTQPLPLVALLATQQIELTLTRATSASDQGGVCDALARLQPLPSLGVQGQATAEGFKLKHVFNGGAAQAAGLSAGDVLLAINQRKITDLDQQLQRYRIGEQVCLHVFRRERLREFSVCLQAAADNTCWLRLLSADAGAWLNG